VLAAQQEGAILLPQEAAQTIAARSGTNYCREKRHKILPQKQAPRWRISSRLRGN
jgi:hypothetical protein